MERYGWRIGWCGARCGRRDEKSERSGGGAARPETMAIDLPRGRRRNRKLPMNRDDRWKLALLKRLVIFLAAFVGGRWALRSSQRSLPRAAVLQSRISPRPFPSIYRVTTATNTTTIIVIIMVFLCQIAPIAWHVRFEWVVLRFGALYRCRSAVRWIFVLYLVRGTAYSLRTFWMEIGAIQLLWYSYGIDLDAKGEVKVT